MARGGGAWGRELLVALPLVVAAAAAALLVAGCGGAGSRPPASAAPPTAPAGPATTMPAAAAAAPAATAPVAPPAGVLVAIQVVDGDTGQPVLTARVRFGADVLRRAGARGVATARVLEAAALRVTVTAPGYRRRVLALAGAAAGESSRRIVLYRRATQWPMYGVNPARTQAQEAIRLRPPFRQVWSQGLGSMLEFPAVVYEGAAFIITFDGAVHALSMKDGRELWRYSPPDGKSASSPAVWGDLLVVHDMRGQVTLLDRATGAFRWVHDFGSPIESSPVVVGGVDLFGAWDGRIVALDLRSRVVRWTVATGAKVTASAAVVGDDVVIGDYDGRVRVLSLATGAVRWTATVNGRVYGTPAVAAGRVFVPSSSGATLTAFDLADGHRLWQRRAGSYVYSAPAVWGDRVVFGSYDGQLRCLDAATGETVWSVGLGGPISGAVVAIAGIAYAGSFAHRILGVEIATGATVFDFPHGEYVPVSGNGARLLLHGFSRIFAVEPAP